MYFQLIPSHTNISGKESADQKTIFAYKFILKHQKNNVLVFKIFNFNV